MSIGSLEDQARLVLQVLEGIKNSDRSSPIYRKTLEWVGNWPTAVDVGLRRRIIDQACRAFAVTESDIYLAVDVQGTTGVSVGQNGYYVQKVESGEAALRKILPKGGWFEWYDHYTKNTESPLSYHIFCSLCVLGAACGRRVHLNFGHFNIYPNYCVLLIGPTGRVHKTSACDIAKYLVVQAALCPVMADKITPEHMVTVMAECGHQFIYAGEMSNTFGKQRYNEGFITQMLRLLDCPESYTVGTERKGDIVVNQPVLSILAATTPSLLATSTPEEAISSGFLNRFIMVVENDTERCFDVPEKGAGVEAKLIESAKRLTHYTGQVVFTDQARGWYRDWYRTRWHSLRQSTDETEVEVLARSPVHLLRTAMLIHLVQCDNMALCVSCLEVAKALTEYVERNVPKAINAIKKTAVAQDSDFVLEMLKKLGGAADHSTMVRRCQPRMNATSLKGHIKTLEESGRIKVGRKGNAMYYVVIEESKNETT